MRPENLKKGAYFLLLASIAYAIMALFVKWGRTELSNEQMVFMRNFVCLVLFLPWMFFPEKTSFKTKVLHIHFIRAVAGLLNMYCFFYSINYILLADAMLLNNTMPLFVPFVVWLWTRKKFNPKLIPGLLIGFVGIAIVLKPNAAIFQPAAILALASGFFMSVSMAGLRELGKKEPIHRILFYYFAISSFISFFPMLWAWEPPSALFWLLLIGIGATAAIYQVFLTKGYWEASASKISPIIYFAVILSAFFDWIFWKKNPDVLTFIGIVLVVIGAVLTLKLGTEK